MAASRSGQSPLEPDRRPQSQDEGVAHAWQRRGSRSAAESSPPSPRAVTELAVRLSTPEAPEIGCYFGMTIFCDLKEHTDRDSLIALAKLRACEDAVGVVSSLDVRRSSAS